MIRYMILVAALLEPPASTAGQTDQQCAPIVATAPTIFNNIRSCAYMESNFRWMNGIHDRAWIERDVETKCGQYVSDAMALSRSGCFEDEQRLFRLIDDTIKAGMAAGIGLAQQGKGWR